MSCRGMWTGFLTVVCLCLAVEVAHAQPPAVGPAVAPAAPVVTVWNKLGIPQAFNKAKDVSLNRRGNHPGLERTDPLKRIADPANLESPNKAISAAAKIKADQDLAPQKIKAIKFLATVGCGCYQKSVDVRGALLAALDDCSEEVRYEAAKALAGAAGDACDKCGNSCCNATVMTKLQDMASGTDGKCCPKEGSERVREAAKKALDACKQKFPAAPMPAGPTPATPPKGNGPEKGEREPVLRPVPPPPSDVMPPPSEPGSAPPASGAPSPFLPDGPLPGSKPINKTSHNSSGGTISAGFENPASSPVRFRAVDPGVASAED